MVLIGALQLDRDELRLHGKGDPISGSLLEYWVSFSSCIVCTHHSALGCVSFSERCLRRNEAHEVIERRYFELNPLVKRVIEEKGLGIEMISKDNHLNIRL